MNVFIVGFPFRTVPVAIRERLALSDADRDLWALQLSQQYRCEAMVLSTCNRFEIYLAWPLPDDVGRVPSLEDVVSFVASRHQVVAADLIPLTEHRRDHDAVRHLGRVAASLDSLVVGEGQIAAQVKTAFEASRAVGSTGTVLNTLVPHMLKAAKRVRSETGIARGHVSISSVAVDFARQVFDQFHDKSVLVIGAGKMARLTLTHLKHLAPKEIVVTNRSSEKADEMAGWCGGRSVPFDQLAPSLIAADIVLSATGAPTAIVTAEWFHKHVRPHRRHPLVVLDIAVPRDFDPEIHDGADVSVFNVDDLTRVREQTLAERRSHLAPAESIIDSETTAFLVDWQRRRSGPIIRDLTMEFDRIRDGVVTPLLAKWNGKLSAEDKQQLEYAFKLFQNQLMHGPIAALQDASKSGDQPTMLDVIKKLFRLKG
jgi:glutamyl-tRNA reductase